MLHDEEVDLLEGEAVLIRLPLLLDDGLVVHEDLEVQAEVGRHVELRARLRRVRLLKADQKEGEGRPEPLSTFFERRCGKDCL